MPDAWAMEETIMMKPNTMRILDGIRILVYLSYESWM